MFDFENFLFAKLNNDFGFFFNSWSTFLLTQKFTYPIKDGLVVGAIMAVQKSQYVLILTIAQNNIALFLTKHASRCAISTLDVLVLIDPFADLLGGGFC